MKNVLNKLVDYLQNRCRLDKSLFSEDFIYDTGLKGVDASYFLSTNDDVLSNHKDLVEVTNTKLILQDHNKKSGTIIFESEDPITFLLYRICWVVMVDDSGKIAKIIDVRNTIQNK